VLQKILFRKKYSKNKLKKIYFFIDFYMKFYNCILFFFHLFLLYFFLKSIFPLVFAALFPKVHIKKVPFRRLFFFCLFCGFFFVFLGILLLQNHQVRTFTIGHYLVDLLNAVFFGFCDCGRLKRSKVN